MNEPTIKTSEDIALQLALLANDEDYRVSQVKKQYATHRWLLVSDEIAWLKDTLALMEMDFSYLLFPKIVGRTVTNSRIRETYDHLKERLTQLEGARE